MKCFSPPGFSVSRATLRRFFQLNGEHGGKIELMEKKL